MKKMIKFTERSFWTEDIPEQFYVVTDIQHNLKIDDLQEGVLTNVTGVSGSANIVLGFMGVARDLIITMDGQELVKLNKLTRIMYDNPHYLVSNNMEALARMFQSQKDDYYHIFHNLFDYMKIFMKKSSNSAYDELYYEWDYGRPPHFEFEEVLSKMNFKIDNLADFTKLLIKVSNKIPKYKGKEYFENLSFQDVYDLAEGSLKIAGNIFHDESEWILKDKKLILPKKTKLIIGIENYDFYQKWKKGELTPTEEFMMSSYTEEHFEIYNQFFSVVEGKYPYTVMEMKDFRKVQGDIMNNITGTVERADALLSKYPELKV